MSDFRLLYVGLVPCLIYLWLSLQPQVPTWTWKSPELRDILLDKGNQWCNGTTVQIQGQEGFSEVRITMTDRWNTFDAPTYSAAISPATEDDVVKTVCRFTGSRGTTEFGMPSRVLTSLPKVLLAAKHQVPFLATGGRHGYTTSLGRLRNGLAIDLSALNEVGVDESAGILTVGGGVRWSQVLDSVFDAGFQMQTGICSCPGVVGVTLGGGIGRYSGRFGLVIDALLSVRLVTADGRLLNVSENSHPDLFWAIRGAGANFGVVTSATYKLQRLATDTDSDQGHVLMADMVFPAAKTAEYFKILESFNDSMPANLAVYSIIMYSEGDDDAQIMTNWVFMGPESEGRAAMQQVLELQPSPSLLRTVPWSEITASQGFGMLDAAFCQTAADRSVYGVNVRQLHAATYQSVFEKMRTFFREYPEARGSAIALETWPNQAALAVPDEATAYPWRDAKGNFLLVFTWPSSNPDRGEVLAEASNKLGRELRNDFSQTSGYPDLSVFVSYAHSDETVEQIYGRDKLPRLAALKKKWDPLNAFAYNNPLPMEYPEKNGE
ncbi:putative fad binding domain protein [Colletotrichum karsti]|uniref:Fad binding domain protein n=1 Tax=Colletotrichum karsti TaxID=1095194 RepID=A0A9P6IA87_9PEZI|nr:putative fad binding domain protein [Colletotrichum karsti]KAF9878632.1 putative fad binding domain protein [Colletotrichum karsti]